MPVEKIGALIQEKSPKALYHVDGIQAFGKYRIYPKKWGIHLLSVSGHKIHGPKGVGFLYINSRAKVQPLIWVVDSRMGCVPEQIMYLVLQAWEWRQS